MIDYVCVTLLGRPGEAEAAFKARLVQFWTHFLRTRPDEYAKVYAESREFAVRDGVPTREYMVEVNAVEAVTAALTTGEIAFAAVDLEDTYTKYEAASPEWFQIPH